MASTSKQITPRWNVFLSFRGEDTRRNFTGHLHKALDRAGIQTFMDDSELPRGEEISLGLLKAIQDSEISIVVFSKNYASSTWCLDELEKILECRKTMGQLVLPVFYNVHPSDVRYQCGNFAEAFEKHKIRFVGDMDKVGKWRAMLTEATDLSGYHLDENGYEADLIEKIVDKVLLEVNPINLNVAKEPVRIDSHVKDIIKLLSIGTNGVRWNELLFGKAKPLDEFMELSKDIVSYAGGLPLAHEVLGSNLSDQTMIRWKSFVEKLQHIPNNEIQEEHIINFDALDDDNVKDIFLDFVCYFIRIYVDDAVTVLGSYYSIENEINNLIKLCLLKIIDKNELRMHDLISDMGRRNARNKFPKEPGKQSRL